MPDDEDMMPRQPGDYCEDCRENVASDGACYCPDPDDDPVVMTVAGEPVAESQLDAAIQQALADHREGRQ